MCYSATHLEKLDGTREAQWQKVARLTPGDMACVTNLEYLGVPGEGGVGVGGWVGGCRRRLWGGLIGAELCGSLLLGCHLLSSVQGCLPIPRMMQCASEPRAAASPLGASGGVRCVGSGLGSDSLCILKLYVEHSHQDRMLSSPLN